MAEDEPELPPDRAALAEQIVRSAWRDLPAYDRELLQNIGASQWQVTTHDLGRVVDDLLRSAGHGGLRPKDVVRLGGYRRVEYTHELVAEIYALLMSRRRRGQRGQPSWLGDEIYDLVRRVSGWSE